MYCRQGILLGIAPCQTSRTFPRVRQCSRNTKLSWRRRRMPSMHLLRQITACGMLAGYLLASTVAPWMHVHSDEGQASHAAAVCDHGHHHHDHSHSHHDHAHADSGCQHGSQESHPHGPDDGTDCIACRFLAQHSLPPALAEEVEPAGVVAAYVAAPVVFKLAAPAACYSSRAPPSVA